MLKINKNIDTYHPSGIQANKQKNEIFITIKGVNSI